MTPALIFREDHVRERVLLRLASILSRVADAARAESTVVERPWTGGVAMRADGLLLESSTTSEDDASFEIVAGDDAVSVTLRAPVPLDRIPVFDAEDPNAVRSGLDHAVACLKAATDPARCASLDLQAAVARRLDAVACVVEGRGAPVSAGIRVCAPGPQWDLGAQGYAHAGPDASWAELPVEASWWAGLPPVAALMVVPPRGRPDRPGRRAWSMELGHVGIDWRGLDDHVARLRLLGDMPRDAA